jgi:transcriptional regulator with PAS, ATPase and Fis domain
MSETFPHRPYFGAGCNVGRIIHHINAAAAVNCAVLIRGETGCGKGILARWIHNHSPRKEREFVDINCVGLKGELLKSELFGHARGSFTGAVNDRPGLIEIADGGTLFLDEVGDMDVNVQCQLLKAIEEKSFRRIGENGKRSSDFRLICATNRNLPEAMKDGSFRTDLFFRINTFPINIPPLRERKEDIPGLMTHILKEMSYGTPLSNDVIDTLTRYPWPGNIRELRNAAERALIFAKDTPLTPEHFAGLGNDDGAETMAETAKSGTESTWTDPADSRHIWNLKDLENHQILRALKQFNSDKTKTCKALGISMSSLYRKLDKISDKRQPEEWLKGADGLENT